MTDRDEWLVWRREGIGASDVAAIVGLSPWVSLYSLWTEKVGLVDSWDAENQNMEFGRRVEPMLAEWFEDVTGLCWLGEQTMVSNPEWPWMRCTLDGFVCESPESAMADALGGGEIKTTGDTPESWEAELPDHYRCQGQWTMAVTGFDRVWFATLHLPFGRRAFRVHELKRDEADIAFLTAAAEDFWWNHVEAGVPPPTDASAATTRALKAAWKGESGLEVDLSEHAQLIGFWRDAKLAAKAATEAVDGFENEIRALMADASEGLVDGRLALSWRSQSSRRIDAKALAAVHPDIATEFTNTTVSRVLRAHVPKESNARR